MDSQVRRERHGEPPLVAELVLDRPGALNALSTGFAAQLRDAVAELAVEAGSGSVRAVVLSSSQAKAFCVGADLRERSRFDEPELAAQREVFRSMAAAVRELPVPVVAAVAGYAMGGGFELALLCDLIVADRTAVLALPEVSVGVIPGLGGTQLLSRRVGLGRASDVVLTARRLDAAEALGMGAVDRVVADGAARTAAVELAASIAAHSPVAVHNARRALRQGFDADLATGLQIEDDAWRASAFSPDRIEGVRAFLEKRRPRWPDPGT
jgi:enoyl-CoA hydratase/carnithine racemase